MVDVVRVGAIDREEIRRRNHLRDGILRAAPGRPVLVPAQPQASLSSSSHQVFKAAADSRTQDVPGMYIMASSFSLSHTDTHRIDSSLCFAPLHRVVGPFLVHHRGGVHPDAAEVVVVGGVCGLLVAREGGLRCADGGEVEAVRAVTIRPLPR